MSTIPLSQWVIQIGSPLREHNQALTRVYRQEIRSHQAPGATGWPTLNCAAISGEQASIVQQLLSSMQKLQFRAIGCRPASFLCNPKIQLDRFRRFLVKINQMQAVV